MAALPRLFLMLWIVVVKYIETYILQDYRGKMPTYEYTTKLNVQDGPESEFEAVKREVLEKVSPESHHCLVTRNGKIETVRFSTFKKTAEGEIFVIFHPISSYPVQEEYCLPSEVHLMDNRHFEWTEDHLSRVGYRTQEVKEVER